MKKLILCTAAVLGVAVSIFGGYYYYVTDDSQETEVQQDRQREESEGDEATDNGLPYEYRSIAWREEDGSINPNGLSNAIAQRDYYLAQNNPAEGFGDDGVARGTEFSPIGPQNLGGRTEAILVHPHNSKIVWAGGASGGVWISYDGGVNWSATNGVLGNFNVSCLALDPGDPSGDTIYAGTGAYDRNGDGIFRSTNRGMTWTRLHGHEEGWKYVSSIAVSRNSGDTVVLAAVDNNSLLDPAEHGIMRYIHPDHGADTWTRVINAPSGIAVGFDPNVPSTAVASVCYGGDSDDPDGRCTAFYSTNYGASWSPSVLGDAPVAIPEIPVPLFVSPRANDSIQFAFQKSPSGPSVIYAQYGDAEPTVMSRSTNGGAYFSTNGLEGNPEGISRGVPAFWVSPAVADPADQLVIITGGTSLFRSINGVFEQHPIGGTVVPLHDPPYPHVDMQTVVTDPGGETNKSVFLGTDGGIFHANDISTVTGAWPRSTPSGWTVRNSKLQNTQYFTVAGDASPGSGIISGGSQDNGTLRLTGKSPITAHLLGGDGGLSAVDGTDCFGQDTSRNIYRIYNCSTASPESPNLVEVATEENMPDYLPTVPFVPMPFIVDPAPGDPNRAFLAVKGVWKTSNLRTQPRPTWTPIKPNEGVIASPTPTHTGTPTPTPTQTGTPSATPTGSPTPIVWRPRITAMAVAPTDSNYIWVAEYYPDHVEWGFGHLWRTTTALATSPSPVPSWTPVDCSAPHQAPIVCPSPQQTSQMPNRAVTKILIDQDGLEQPDDIVYVGFGGYDDNNLWRTRDEGASWQDISGGVASGTCLPNDPLVGLPCAPIRAIARHPRSPNTLFVGTEIGIYVTTDLNEPNVQNIRWEPVMNGPANVSIDDLEFVKHSNVLVAATWGRGLWATDFGPGPGPSPTPSLNHAVNDFDGDGRSDIAVVREDGSDLVWHKDGTTEGYSSTEFGAPGDQIAPADYDGDGKVDMTFYRPGETKWYSLMSSTNTVATTTLGVAGVLTTSGDFDGDDTDDEAIFDTATGDWHVEQSTNGHLDFHWGAIGDTPVSVDFSGDGAADFGVFREADGMQTLYYLDAGVEHEQQFGLEGDIPVSGDYDGDGKADIAFWRPDDGDGNGCWYITYAEKGFVGYDSIPWGLSSDVPVPGDYDGDGKMDVAVWRPSDGMWHILESSNGYYSQLFGADGDTPVGRKAATYASRPGSGGFQKAPPGARPERRGHNPVRSPVKTSKEVKATGTRPEKLRR